MNFVSRLVLSMSLAMLLSGGTAAAQNPVVPKPALEGPLAKLCAADPNDDELRKLMKERVKETALYVRQLEERMGRIPTEDFTAQLSEFMAASKRLGDYTSELVNTPDERIAALTLQFERAKDFEKKIAQRAEAGTGAPHLLMGARAFRLDAEIQFLKAKTATMPAAAIPVTSTAVWSIPQVVSEEKVGLLRRLRNRIHN